MAGRILISAPGRCVADCLEGVALAAPGVQLVDGRPIAVRADLDVVKARGQVAVLCGGGAGHEPAHAGFVGRGLLAGAVSGPVFASPPPADVEEAMLQLGAGNPGGVLAVVKNYTGDRLNFGIAAERARRRGVEVAMLVVDEDCALQSANKSVGRRGLAGAILVNKVAGAMAEEGRVLSELRSELTFLVASMATVGVALSPCLLPGADRPAFEIPTGECELGLGIHGEAGVRRERLADADACAGAMLRHMLSPDNANRLALERGEEVLLLVNNLGAMSQLEMFGMTRAFISLLETEVGVSVARVLVGSFVTSLNMAGLSLTLLRLRSPAWLSWIDAPTAAPAWQCFASACEGPRLSLPRRPRLLDVGQTPEDEGAPMDADDARLFVACAHAACDALVANARRLDALDSAAGDADCGSTHARAAAAVSRRTEALGRGSLARAFALLSEAAETDMGGTSGGLYCLFFSALSATLRPDARACAADLFPALDRGIEAIQRAGNSGPGDRTLLDAMLPLREHLRRKAHADSPVDLRAAAAEVRAGADATSRMRARAGRASYVGAAAVAETNDPGAEAFALMVEAAVARLTSEEGGPASL